MSHPPSTRPRRLLAAATAVALLVGAASCSSDSDGSKAKATTSTTGAKGTSTTKPASAGAPNDTVSDLGHLDGPITGGKYAIPYLAMPDGWEDDYGYTEEEFFIEGDARAFTSAKDLGAEGRWEAAQSGKPAAYKTRIMVRRPKDEAEFNGTVVVEWLNVSAGRDSDPDFGFLADELMTEGYAYVAVSAQRTGVEPGGLGIDVPGVPPEALAPLKTWDPERYGSLSHPGDAYSYDIFSQAAKSLVGPDPGGPLGGLEVEHLLAVGESQSAFRMVTYVNAVQPVTDLFDGFLVHSRNSGAADLNDDQKAPDGVQIRTDTDVPVFQFETETDLDFLSFVKARQDDSEQLVTWEVAGTAHADRSTLDYGVTAGRRWTDANVDLSTECGEVNDGPQQPVVQAAFAALSTWVVDGTQPPQSPLIEIGADGEIVRDADGLAKGGIRTPPVDAPTYALSGENPASSIICVLFGSQKALTEAQLAARYEDHDDYVAQVVASADRAVEDGFLLPNAAEAMVDEAEKADIP